MPDLRSVSEGQDQLVITRDGGERTGGDSQIAALDLDGDRLASAREYG